MIIVLEKFIAKVHFVLITDLVSFLTQIDALTLTKKIIVDVDKDVLIIKRFVDAAFRELKEKRRRKEEKEKEGLRKFLGSQLDLLFVFPLKR